MLTGMRKRIHYIRQANLNDMYEKNQVIYLSIDRPIKKMTRNFH